MKPIKNDVLDDIAKATAMRQSQAMWQKIVAGSYKVDVSVLLEQGSELTLKDLEEAIFRRLRKGRCNDSHS